MDAKSIGRKIRNRRDGRGISMAELARRADVSRATVWGVEHGLWNISLETLSRLAEGLGTSVGDLIA